MAPADAQPAPGAVPAVDVVVTYAAGPRRVELVSLRLPAGTPVIEAVRRSGLADRHAEVAGWLGHPPSSRLVVAVWHRRCEAQQPLRDRDRVELLRPLTVDPKEARRQRYRSQGRPRRAVSGSPTR